MIQGWRRYAVTTEQQYTYSVDDVGTVTRRKDGVKIKLRGAHAAIWETAEFAASCGAISMDYPAEVRQEVALRHLELGRCKCGVYITKDDIAGAGASALPIRATVVGWGAFVEYESGWRTQFARITSLIVQQITAGQYDHVLAKELETRYGVPVTTEVALLCCGQDHTKLLFKEDSKDVPICKVSEETLRSYAKLYRAMGDIPFATNSLKDIIMEGLRRGVTIGY